MIKKNPALKIQKLFPIIYVACHVEHIKKKTNTHNLSAKDASLLSHLEINKFQSPTNLAKHLNITQASLHESLMNLKESGFIKISENEDDARKRNIVLTEKGNLAIKETSVLDYNKLNNIFSNMNEEEIETVVKGFEILIEKI